jgi:hypothetical protein
MNNFKVLLIFALLLFSNWINAQLEFSNWYFGQGAGLNFSVSPPSAIIDGNILSTAEGVATISDSNGNLLFYTDGSIIGTKNHTLMSNGSGLLGDQSSTQSAIIVKQPGNTNIYYVFTVYANIASYNIIDMNLAAGYGSVTVKNATLYLSTSEKQVSVRHCNGVDVWIISHERNTNNFRSYLLSSSGLNLTPVISSIGEVTNGAAALGQMKISPDGRKLAMACDGSATLTSLGLGGFQLFDFNIETGIISNSIIVNNTVNGAYGIEFSPNGSYLYGSISPLSNSVNAALYQWNICQTSTAAIISSQYSVGFNSVYGTASIQRAIDGKVYVAPNDPSNFATVHVINSPNNAGSAMGLALNAISTGTKTVRLGLPNFINNYTKPVPAMYGSTLACQNASFAAPAAPTLSNGCGAAAAYSYNATVWDFGEPSSGAANTSTAGTATHAYGGIGSYTATLILYSNCTNDTLKKVSNVTAMGPNPSVTGTTSICKGDKYTYTATGGSSYVWLSGTSTLATSSATTSTVALNPTLSTVYTINSFSNGCSASTTLSITVNKCLGIKDESTPLSLGEGQGVRLFPNPSTGELHLTSAKESEELQLKIVDLSGKVILNEKVKTINYQYYFNLNGTKGIYFVEIEDNNKHVSHQKIILYKE